MTVLAPPAPAVAIVYGSTSGNTEDAAARIAGFGAGDPEFYPDTFGDALGIVMARLERAGAALVGAWPAEPYLFDDSQALRGETPRAKEAARER